MGVGVECKQESSNEETSSSAMDTGLNTSLTVAKSNAISITGQDNVYKRKTSSVDALTSTIPVGRADVVRVSTLQPATKRIKIENEETITITDASKDEAVADRANDNGIGTSSNVVEKVLLATTTSVPIMDSHFGMTNPVASASAGCDGVTASTTATAERSGTTKPQHSVTPTIAKGQQQQSEGIPSISASNCSTGSAKVAQNAPVKDEASSSSSNNNQGGSSSVITASVASSPQHTSQSSNTSADSSNESMHDSETNRSTVASAPPTTSTKSLPSVSRAAVQPTTAGTSKAHSSQVSNTNAVTKNNSPLATAKSAGTRTIPSPSKPVPARTHIPPSSATSATTVSVSKSSINAITLNKEVPLKSLNFGHLRIKYLGELEYMLREFRKLERQLLGAKGAQQLEESVGSRERREKLHSFILHLEDTIRQIEIGCKLEVDGQSSSTENRNVDASATIKDGANDASASATAVGNGNNLTEDATSSTCKIAAEEAKKQLAQESALSNLTKEKEEEETVQKLEEHILANLLPVKVRLKKQLAAQQGATQNPPGMPAMGRGNLRLSSTTRGKGTFVEAVEKKRQIAESRALAAQVQLERQVRSVSDPTQFGKPLSGVGSSLTKRIHGAKLGSNGVGSSNISKGTHERKILHAGMVPKSTQQKSGLSAASGVHEIVKSPTQNNNTSSNNPATAALAASISVKPNPAQALQVSTKICAIPEKQKRVKVEPKTSGAATTVARDASKQNKSVATSSSAPLSEEDKLKFKKHRRLRKLKRLKRRRERELARQQLPKSQQQLPNNTQSASNTIVGRKKAGHAKVGQKKKGPRVVEYICSQCSEAYSSTCEFNPWWALAQHKCPKCQKTQIPRIDITSPANIIEYHPALLSHLEDGGRGGGGSIPANSAQTVTLTMPIVSQIPDGANSINSESDSDLSELSDDNISIGSLKAAELESELQSMTPAERAEHETFGEEYEGPVLSEDHAAKLLVLMGHASTCPCHHKSEKLKDICRSTKYMMLHVRDCPGTTSTCDVCPFPWCRKVKHLLYHLVSCKEPDQCAICSPKDLPKGLQGLVGLNAHRMKKHREQLITIAKANLAAKGTKLNPATKKQTTTRRATSATQANNTRKILSDTKPSVAPQNSAAQRPVSIQAPVKPKVKKAPPPAPYISSTTVVASVDTGVSNIIHIKDPMVTQAHTEIIQHSIEVKAASNDLDFDINAEIAKLGELVSDAQNLNETCTIISAKRELETSTTIPIVTETVETGAVECPPMNYAIISASETTNDPVLSTTLATIKLDDHDVDAAELSDLLASNRPSEEHAINNPMDLGDVSEYLKNEYQIPSQHPQHSISVTEHQQQIDIDSGVPGVDTLDDPNSDPLANINHEIFIETSDVSLVPASTNTCVELKQEYSEAVRTTSAQATHDVSTVTATASDVEQAIGSVKVN